MPQIILLRHSKAVASAAAGDHARGLSPRGFAEAQETATLLKRRIAPDFALVSDARRTRETFDRLIEEFGQAIPHRFEHRLYGATPDMILDLVGELPSDLHRLLVVGHNPGLGDLARHLARSGDRAVLGELSERFPTSAFAIITLQRASWTEADEGGVLETFTMVNS